MTLTAEKRLQLRYTYAQPRELTARKNEARARVLLLLLLAGLIFGIVTKEELMAGGAMMILAFMLFMGILGYACGWRDSPSFHLEGHELFAGGPRPKKREEAHGSSSSSSGRGAVERSASSSPAQRGGGTSGEDKKRKPKGTSKVPSSSASLSAVSEGSHVGVSFDDSDDDTDSPVKLPRMIRAEDGAEEISALRKRMDKIAARAEHTTESSRNRGYAGPSDDSL